ncbi:cysteine desulfurase DndA [Nocardioides sp. C4-1]|uniref:cysteine desulfurase DndA n=1 Tax=Nocardioides sp. C4-1 TaxID=3151851 RepID=UPI003266218F
MTATYLDCNATTPVDPRVVDEVTHYLCLEYGNAGSRTHGFGQAAKERVNKARIQVSDLVSGKPDEVVFTSGATESNNLAILGLAAHAHRTGRRHIISTQIEHKAVLEPLERLQAQGFEVTALAPTPGGWIDPDAVRRALRPDTVLVSVMAVNNETGVEQPLREIAVVLGDHPAYFHVDAAQAFGKVVAPLRDHRIDMLSISGHKLFAPKGLGALVARRRGYDRVPLTPLMVGGGQERGLRPGTLPVHLIAGLGTAASIAAGEHQQWVAANSSAKTALLEDLSALDIVLNGDPERTVPWTLNFSVPGVDSEAALVALKDLVAVSNGSACTSASYDPSHVLTAAGLPQDQVAGALRLSWSHLTPAIPGAEIAARLASLRR